MSKKRTGLLIAFGAAVGAAVAGISYYLRYKSFNDELDQDFHDYEDSEADTEKEDDVSVPDSAFSSVPKVSSVPSSPESPSVSA